MAMAAIVGGASSPVNAESWVLHDASDRSLHRS